MDVSKNLGNEPHFDVNDAGPGISIWLMENPDNEHKEPYFILPNCSINGSKGVAIKLYHGIIIEWDGRLLKHCTQHPGNVLNNTLFGLFFGPKKSNCLQRKGNGNIYIGLKSVVQAALDKMK